MSHPSNVCRLCVTVYENGKSMYDANGRNNELHEIISKYFHPSIVNIGEAKHLRAICSQCWHSIYDFHSYQTSVAVAQLTLLTGGVSKDENNAAELINEESDLEGVEISTEDNKNGDTLIASDAGPAVTSSDMDVIDVDSSIDSGADDDMDMSKNPTEMSLTSRDRSHIKISAAVSEVFSSRCEESFDKIVNNWLPNIKCAICFKSYPKFSLLENHFQLRHPEEQFYVKCCSRRITKRRIKQHALLHRDPDVFKCGLCGKTYTQKACLKLHVSVKHPQYMKILCKLCGKPIESRKSQMLHYSTEHATDPAPKGVIQLSGRTKYPCSMCENISNTLIAFYHHYWFVHKNWHRYYCGTCNRRYSEKRDLFRHLHITKHKLLEIDEFHSQESRKLSVKNTDENNCQTKNKSSAKKMCSSLRSATARTTTERITESEIIEIDSETEFITDYCRVCPDCDKVFGSDREMIEHLASEHRNMDLYSCPSCPKSFRMVTQIPKHRKRKHPKELKGDYYKTIDDQFHKLLNESMLLRKSRNKRSEENKMS